MHLEVLECHPKRVHQALEEDQGRYHRKKQSISGKPTSPLDTEDKGLKKAMQRKTYEWLKRNKM